MAKKNKTNFDKFLRVKNISSNSAPVIKVDDAEEKLYPLFYNGKWWNEDDCSDVFVSFYYSRFDLGSDMSVYVADDERIKPDGSWV